MTTQPPCKHCGLQEIMHYDDCLSGKSNLIFKCLDHSGNTYEPDVRCKCGKWSSDKIHGIAGNAHPFTPATVHEPREEGDIPCNHQTDQKDAHAAVNADSSTAPKFHPESAGATKKLFRYTISHGEGVLNSTGKWVKHEDIVVFVNLLEKDKNTFVHENFMQDPETGAWEGGGQAKNDWVEQQEELIERLRSIV